MLVRSPAGAWKTTSRAGVPDGDRHGSDGPDRVQMTIVPQRLSVLRNSSGVSLSVRYTSMAMMPTAVMSRLVELVAGNPSRTKSGLQSRAARDMRMLQEEEPRHTSRTPGTVRNMSLRLCGLEG